MTSRASLMLAIAAAMTLAGELRAEPLDAASKEFARYMVLNAEQQSARGDDDAALESLRRAYEAAPVPLVGNRYARALERRGLLVEARNVSMKVLTLDDGHKESKESRKARIECDERAERLGARIPQVRFEISGAPQEEVTIFVDERALPKGASWGPWPMNPGLHLVMARAPGFTEASLAIEAVEPSRMPPDQHPQVVTLHLTRLPAAKPEQMRSARTPAACPPAVTCTGGRRGMPTWALGTGIVGMGLAVGAGAFAIDWALAERALDEACPAGMCDTRKFSFAEVNDMQGRVQRDRNLTLGLAIPAVVALGATVIGWVGATQARPTVGPAVSVLPSTYEGGGGLLALGSF